MGARANLRYIVDTENTWPRLIHDAWVKPKQQLHQDETPKQTAKPVILARQPYQNLKKYVLE